MVALKRVGVVSDASNADPAPALESKRSVKDGLGCNADNTLLPGDNPSRKSNSSGSVSSSEQCCAEMLKIADDDALVVGESQATVLLLQKEAESPSPSAEVPEERTSSATGERKSIMNPEVDAAAAPISLFLGVHYIFAP
ncbi:hypothetical protein NL676_013608 [Syzygium grande]|nr:hypothetical protein NL676_013608 [Syzygium grande]